MNDNFVVNDTRIKAIKQKIKHRNKISGYVIGIHISTSNDTELSKHMFIGWSRCDKKYDNFDRVLGTKIAIIRALKIANAVRNNNYDDLIGANKHTLANCEPPPSLYDTMDVVESRCASYLGNVGSVYSYYGQWIQSTPSAVINSYSKNKVD